MVQYNFPAIGTSWYIDINSAVSPSGETALLKLIKDRIEIFDKTYSRFRADSLVTQMSKESGDYILPDDAKKMIELYYDLYLETNGLMTPMIGNLLSDAGYDAQYSLKQQKELETPILWEQAIEYEYPKIKIKKPVLLDFGAAGKGYLIDLVAEVIESQGIKEYCIDAGGDILQKGKSSIRVGLENPENPKEAIGIYQLQNESICGSAGNRRKWGKFTHIINPATLSSPNDIIAVFTVAESAMLADALSTASFFVNPAKLQKKYNFQYLIERADHSVERSPGFNAQIFLA